MSQRPTLQLGEVGEWVAYMKGAFKEVLAFPFSESFPLDDCFDEACETALRAWQMSEGLEPDGIVGPKTWRVLLREADHEGPAPDTSDPAQSDHDWSAIAVPDDEWSAVVAAHDQSGRRVETLTSRLCRAAGALAPVGQRGYPRTTPV